MNISQHERPPKHSKTRQPTEHEKILLVDDLNDNLLALEGLLRREDCEIITARSGTEALEFMLLHEFALALIDVQMPMMSGFELAELMRGASKTKNIPIIFVTATAEHQSFAFKGYESGAVDFLLKPLDTHAVKSKVNIFIELHRSQREQKQLLLKLTKTQAELEQAVLIRDEFMSIASHELKTPLTSLKLQAQLRKRNLAKGLPDAFTPERLAKMFSADERQLERITHLIDDMLDVSRISAGHLSLRLEQFDLGALVRDLVDRSSEHFVAAGCPVSVEAPEPVMGTWDRFRIEQVMMNLLTNAMRYGAGKSILVQVNYALDQARIVVSDHGQGIALANHERIFQKFERAVSGNEISGLGLGLYIVRQIVDAHHGSIQIVSELGQGAAFTVKLPGRESKMGAHHDV